MKNFIKYAFGIMFILIISFGCVLNCRNLKGSMVSGLVTAKNIGIDNGIHSFETQYNDNFYGKLFLVNLNGAYRKMMGQRIIGDVICHSDSLVLLSDIKYETDDFTDDISYTKLLLDYSKVKGIEALYVQHPTKINSALGELPYSKDEGAVNTDEYWISEIGGSGFNILNLCSDEFQANQFYRTDHHWTNESAFNGANAILNAFGIENEQYDFRNFEKNVYKDSFLGSYGIRVGDYFIGKDDFTVLVPKFDTDLSYKHFVDGDITFEAYGTFSECFIDEELINDEEYNNKYNAFLNGGYVENIIINKNSDNKKKLLIISDSFARPMTQYLSLGFYETRYLDPQVGRFNESCIEYIEEYEPDYLVIMYSLEYEEKMIQKDFSLYGADN